MKSKQIILALLLIAGIAFLVLNFSQEKGKKAVESSAPGFEVIDVRDGKKISFADLRGKVIFIHFWATWCEPCKEEIPSVDSLYKEFMSNDKFAMVAILYKDSPSAAHDYMKAKGYTFPVYLDSGDRSANNFGVTGVPETYVIDKKGVLKGRFIGPADWNLPEQKGLISSLLNE